MINFFFIFYFFYENFIVKTYFIHILFQNIDCAYTLETHRF